MTQNRLRIMVVALAGMVVAQSGAAYWVDYEASSGLYPEQTGWTRQYSSTYGGAARYFESGSLVMDSRADQGIYDYAEVDRLIDCAPGELFVAEWRLWVEDAHGPSFEQAIGFMRDGYGALEFGFLPGAIASAYEGWSLSIAPGAFHDYRITSSDMIHYRLWIDGSFARDGSWYLNSLNRSSVGWGDVSQFGGITSMAHWSYVRFGAIPEPGGFLCTLIGAACCVGRRRGFR